MEAVTDAVRSGGGGSLPALVEALDTAPLSPDVQERAVKWLRDGPNWESGMQTVSGGEHRLCAARQQGVAYVVVFSA